jgi:hypothetical protein
LIAKNWKPRFIEKYKSTIRERAIARAKACIALSARNVDELSEEEREIIVKEEEDAVKDSILKSGLFAAMICLGLA